MKLSQEDADIFFRLMWSLQHFVNGELGILPQVSNPDAYANDYGMEEKLEVRNALLKDKTWYEKYVDANPEKVTDRELAIISDWQHFIADRFFIERCLKKHAIFIRDEEVYGVLGLNNGLAELIPTSYLPVYVYAVLLPFKGKIIYDGLLQSSNVIFGRNITAELKDT